MIREYPNGDSAEVKGLTVTVKLGEESMSKIREAALDEIDALRAENAKLRELIRTVWLAGDFRAFLGADEIMERMRELRIEVPHD